MTVERDTGDEAEEQDERPAEPEPALERETRPIADEDEARQGYARWLMEHGLVKE